MSREALRTQLDSQRIEMQRLQVENARYRDEQPEMAAAIDADAAENSKLRAEVERLTFELDELRVMLHESRDAEAKAAVISELEQRLGDEQTSNPRVTSLESEVERLTAVGQELEEQICDARRELERASNKAELDRYRAVDAERQKGEDREQRLVEQLRDARSSTVGSSTPAPSSPRAALSPNQSIRREGSLHDTSSQAPQTAAAAATAGTGQLQPDASGDTDSGSPPTAWASALLAQQIPPLSKFSGEEEADEGESFQAWKEQFDMVAALCGWDNKTKLVNLTTRLKGQAYAFYRSCTAEQRGCYDQLVGQLTKRFTPIRLQGVQSSHFHERKQKPKESVDAYAQDLRRLFYRAYPRVQQGAQEAEDLGRSVLAYQFVAGLQPDIRRKLAGQEGSFDQLLTRARFEEAKLKELGSPEQTTGAQKQTAQLKDQGGAAVTPARGEQGQRHPPRGLICYNCRGSGHFSKNCPKRGRAVPHEARGHYTGGGKAQNVATIVVSESSVTPGTHVEAEILRKKEKASQLRQELQEAELEESLAEAMTTMRVLTAGEEQRDTELGPTLTTTVLVEGVPVTALLDTGSPVTIVSMKFLLQAFQKQRTAEQTPDEWAQTVRLRLKPPSVTLQNYGGGQLNIIRQVTIKVSHGSQTCHATVLV